MPIFLSQDPFIGSIGFLSQEKKFTGKEKNNTITGDGFKIYIYISIELWEWIYAACRNLSALSLKSVSMLGIKLVSQA